MTAPDTDTNNVFASCRIIVTRPGAAGEALARRLTELGAIALHQPAISFAPPNDVAALREAVQNISRYDWLLFTSANAVIAVSEQVLTTHGRLDVALPEIAAVGPATAAVIRTLGWTTAFLPTRSSGQALAEQLPTGSGTRVLLPRADIASADLPNELRARDFVVREVVAYRTLSHDSQQSPISKSNRNVDAITFTSPSTVRTFVERARAADWDLAHEQRSRHLLIACIGETTAAAVRQHELQPDVIATEQTTEGLVAALGQELRRRGQMESASRNNSRGS